MPAPLLIFHLVQAWMEVAELCNWKFEVTGKWMVQTSDELHNLISHKINISQGKTTAETRTKKP